MAPTEVQFQPLAVNFTFVWGDTWPLVFQLGSEDGAKVFTPDNLTGATARLQFRNEDDQLLSPVVTPTITPLTGTVDATLSYGSTKVTWDSALFELELTYADGTRRTEVAGTITVNGGRVTDAG